MTLPWLLYTLGASTLSIGVTLGDGAPSGLAISSFFLLLASAIHAYARRPSHSPHSPHSPYDAWRARWYPHSPQDSPQDHPTWKTAPQPTKTLPSS